MSDTDGKAEAIRAVEVEFNDLLAHVRRVIFDHANRVSEGMNPVTYKIFAAIVSHGPLTSSAISERMLMDKGQVSRSVRELDSLGLIAREPDPADGRVSLLAATAAGRERLEAARAQNDSRLHDVLERWDESRIRDLAALLRALTSGEAPPPRL